MPCNSGNSKSCDAGFYLPTSPANADCAPCDKGSYSLGNGTEYYSFEQTLNLFDEPRVPGVSRCVLLA